eukprot:GCRY01001342.1.p1 GENE.GCRY01001342.1~~GCRY01001342.1.p1  ORF type:complete len:271 (+),score=32.65 GCRY01001342.1:111-923(+)
MVEKSPCIQNLSPSPPREKEILEDKELVLWTSKLPFNIDAKVEIQEGIDRALYYRARGKNLSVSRSNSRLKEVCSVPEQNIHGTLKIIVSPHCPSKCVRDALHETLQHLHRLRFDLVVLAVDSVDCTTGELPDTFYEKYKELEIAYDNGLASTIGVCNLSGDQLRSLSTLTKVSPSVDQIKAICGRKNCSLEGYALKHNVQLLTHSDPGFQELFPNLEMKRRILRYYKTDSDFDAHICWIAKYTLLDANTQVIKDRGYVVRTRLLDPEEH